MSAHEDFSREKAGSSSNRSFGFVFAIVFGVIAAWPLLDGESIRWWAAAICGIFTLIAVIAPKWLAPLNRVWTSFGELLHRLTNPLILGVIFFGTITPMAVIMRACRKDLLRLRRRPNATSYWIERAPNEPSPKSMKHQF